MMKVHQFSSQFEQQKMRISGILPYGQNLIMKLIYFVESYELMLWRKF